MIFMHAGRTDDSSQNVNWVSAKVQAKDSKPRASKTKGITIGSAFKEQEFKKILGEILEAQKSSMMGRPRRAAPLATPSKASSSKIKALSKKVHDKLIAVARGIKTIKNDPAGRETVKELLKGEKLETGLKTHTSHNGVVVNIPKQFGRDLGGLGKSKLIINGTDINATRSKDIADLYLKIQENFGEILTPRLGNLANQAIAKDLAEYILKNYFDENEMPPPIKGEDETREWNIQEKDNHIIFSIKIPFKLFNPENIEEDLGYVVAERRVILSKDSLTKADLKSDLADLQFTVQDSYSKLLKNHQEVIKFLDRI